MYWISWARWSSAHGVFFTRERVYRGGRWTPFVRYRRRYEAGWLAWFRSDAS